MISSIKKQANIKGDDEEILYVYKGYTLEDRNDELLKDVFKDDKDIKIIILLDVYDG